MRSFPHAICSIALLLSGPGLVTLCAAERGSLQDPPVPLEPPADKRGFIEVSCEAQSVYPRQPFLLRMRVGIEAEFAANQLIQLFRRPLDFPVQVQAPWLAELPGARLLVDRAATPGPGRRRGTFALDGEAVEATQLDDVVRQGRVFHVLELERLYQAERPGTLVVAGPILRFAYATRFRTDFVNGRVAEDRSDVTVRGSGLELTVRPVPEEGRPPEFRGAVGRFSIRADATPRALAVGDSLNLVIGLSGDGDLTAFEAPDDDAFPGFHVLGRSEEFIDRERVLHYELSPQTNLRELPALRFAAFDPTPPAGFRVHHVAAIPLMVRPAASSAPTVDPITPVPTAPPNETDLEPDKDQGLPRWLIGGVIGGLAILLIGLLRPRRRAKASTGAVDRLAVETFQRLAREPDADLGAALGGYLAARLDCPPSAVIGPDLPTRLQAAGASAELAERASQQMEMLVGARFGGGLPEGSMETTRVLVAELELALGARRS